MGGAEAVQIANAGAVIWTRPPATAPAQNTPPTISNITHESAQINWALPDDGGSPITRSVLHWRAGTSGVFTPINNVIGPFSLTNLAPSTLYQVRVRSDNAVGNGTFSDVTSFTTLAA